MSGERRATPRLSAVILADARTASIVCKDVLSSRGEACLVTSIDEAANALREHAANLLLVAADAPGVDPLDALSCLRRPGLATVLVVTSVNDAQIALAHRSDADATMTTPLDLGALIELAMEPPSSATSTPEPTLEPASIPTIGRSAQMREVWRRVLRTASGRSSVAILGETGAGKELVARAVHRFSTRRHGPFVAINCAAVPETLLESELFGHEKAAFTGATARRKGRFELANGGTLFLDEIGDLSLPLQAKLLRVLQERRFEPLGASQSVEVDVRVVTATNRDLTEAVERGTFRADLYFRLAVLVVRVPPLRERKEDVLGLWTRFLEERAGGARLPETSRAAERLLLAHGWPGNIRELKNAVEHALTVASGGRVLPADLPEAISGGGGRDAAPDLLGLTLAELERLAIQQNVEAMPTIKAAAEALGVSVRKIQYRLREYRADGGSPERRDPTPPPSPVKRQRVLLAEDDDELRWALTDLLRADGYDVVAVPDGKALLQQLGAAVLLEPEGAMPDVIVTDIRMPGVSGVRVLEGVRERGWQTPVILLSAFCDPDTRQTAESLGAAACLEKPVDVRVLQRVLAELAATS